MALKKLFVNRANGCYRRRVTCSFPLSLDRYPRRCLSLRTMSRRFITECCIFFIATSSATILGTARRLSCQVNGIESSYTDMPSSAREWIWVSFNVLCHPLLLSTTGEPYNNPTMLITTYALATLIMLYSEIRTEVRMDRYQYREQRYRPRGERIVVFVVSQAINIVVMFSTRRSIFPDTGAKLSDVDQLAGFCIIIFTMAISTRGPLIELVITFKRRLGVFFLSKSGCSGCRASRSVN